MRIVFLTHRLPYAPDRGDRIRAFHILRTLTNEADVDLVSLVHDDDEASHAGDLRSMCRSVTVAPISTLGRYPAAIHSLLTGRPLTHALLDSRSIVDSLTTIVKDHAPDVVLAYCSGMARFAVAPPLASLPFVLDMVDVDSLKWASLGAQAKWPKGWLYRREARRLAEFEAIAAGCAKNTLVVNERERVAMETVTGAARVHIVPNGIDTAFFRPRRSPVDNAEVVFCGVMSYEPNAEAARWLIKEVWPRVRSRRSDARLTIVGSGPGSDLRQAAMLEPNVEITGRVDDVRPYLWRAAVSVAPLFTARGVQNKVLEATAAGLPSVVTRAVMDGLPPAVRPACTLADDTESFAEEILRLLGKTLSERQMRAAAANLDGLDWAQTLSPLLPILRGASTS